jgi:hypothetical protein
MVDAHYDLHNQAVTALWLAEKEPKRPAEELALAESQKHLARIDPQAVVPGEAPWPLLVGLLLTAIAASLILLPSSLLRGPVAVAPAAQTPATKAAGSRAAETDDSAEQFRRRLQWQPAPSNARLIGHVTALADDSLQRLATEAERRAAGRPLSENERSPQAPVLEPDAASLADRPMVRRYFESIRPGEDELFPRTPPTTPP